jgi:hypothetical protein
VQVEEYAAA